MLIISVQISRTNRREAHGDNKRYLQHILTRNYTSRDGREIVYVGREELYESPSAWPLPHEAPYAAQLNHVILQVIEVIISIR